MVSIRTFMLCSVVLLGACGQTGPLMLPDDNDKKTDVKTTDSSAVSPDRQQATTDTATTSPTE